MVIRSVHLLGVRVDLCTVEDLNLRVADSVHEGGREIIANHNLHSVYLYHHDEKMRSFYRASNTIHVDGMSLVMLGRLLGKPMRREHRITYVDWTPPLFRLAAENKWRVFILGSREGVADRAARLLRIDFPGVEIGTHHGYFDARTDGLENQAILKAIRSFRPDILMVGMGMPRQEHWVHDNLHDIGARAILMAGAAMDYVAGEVPIPPRWSGRWGLEWFFRLAGEPGRLWKRYLVEPWTLLWLALRGRLHRGEADRD